MRFRKFDWIGTGDNANKSLQRTRIRADELSVGRRIAGGRLPWSKKFRTMDKRTSRIGREFTKIQTTKTGQKSRTISSDNRTNRRPVRNAAKLARKGHEKIYSWITLHRNSKFRKGFSTGKMKIPIQTSPRAAFYSKKLATGKLDRQRIFRFFFWPFPETHGKRES